MPAVTKALENLLPSQQEENSMSSLGCKIMILVLGEVVATHWNSQLVQTPLSLKDRILLYPIALPYQVSILQHLFNKRTFI